MPIQSAEYNWKDKCILIVEDNHLTFMLLETALGPTGIKIIHADDGLKGIEAVKHNSRINLVLMDIQIPVINGCDATREIKKINPEMPVIIQTAHTMGDELRDCIKAGCNEYVSKPLVIKSLLRLMNKYLSPENSR
jgi:CheY-like chemotaxis protein